MSVKEASPVNGNPFEGMSPGELVAKVLYAPCHVIDKISDIIAKPFFGEKKQALILTANADHNGAFTLNPLNCRRLIYQRIERIYQTTFKKVSNVENLCKAIDLQAAKKESFNLLVIRAHGDQDCIQLDENVKFCVGDPLPDNSCFHHLPAKSVIILESCSTGKGRELEQNFANYISQHAPPDITIFSATRDINYFNISKIDPIEVRFIDVYNPNENCTYVINGKKHEIVKIEDFTDDMFEDSSEYMDSSDLKLGLKNSDSIQGPEILVNIGQEVLGFVGKIAGVDAAIEELQKVRDIVEVLVKNPEQGAIKVVAELLKAPEQKILNVLNQPKNILMNGEKFIGNPAGNYLGALAAVGGILTFLDSISWICEFGRNPKKAALGVVKMPYSCIEGVVKLGISLIRHPEKAAIQLFKSIIKSPITTVKRFLLAVGLKRRKKRRKHTPPQQVQMVISHEEQMRICKKYAHDLTKLYFLARSKWFIDPYKSIEEYHDDLISDWTPEVAPLCDNNYFNFPQFLAAKFEQEDFNSIRHYSPRAHPTETLAPPEVVIAFQEALVENAKVEIASSVLKIAHQVHVTAINELNVEQERMLQNRQELSALLDNNEERIKQALQAKINAKKNGVK